MINEIFNGIQGEGITQGQYRTFIRFNTCNLSCNFCDTKYTFNKGDRHIGLSDFNDYSDNIVITGGEPTLKNTWEFIHNEVFKKLRGEAGTKVKVSIFRNGHTKLVDFTIVRGKIPSKSIDTYYMISNEIGYMNIKVNV